MLKRQKRPRALGPVWLRWVMFLGGSLCMGLAVAVAVQWVVTGSLSIVWEWFVKWPTYLLLTGVLYGAVVFTLGALLGYVIRFNSEGIEFVMTALFVVLFLEQWDKAKDHQPALVGLGCSLVCLLVLGSEHFLLPAMALILACFFVLRRRMSKEVTP